MPGPLARLLSEGEHGCFPFVADQLRPSLYQRPDIRQPCSSLSILRLYKLLTPGPMALVGHPQLEMDEHIVLDRREELRCLLPTGGSILTRLGPGIASSKGKEEEVARQGRRHLWGQRHQIRHGCSVSKSLKLPRWVFPPQKLPAAPKARNGLERCVR